MAHYAPPFPFARFIVGRSHPFLFPRSLCLCRCIGRAVANKTVDEVGRPISGSAGDALFLVGAIFSRSLFASSPPRALVSFLSLSLSLSFYSILFYFPRWQTATLLHAGFCRTRERARLFPPE